MRDYIVLAIILASLPFCFRRPFIGILMWSWLGYMNPHRFAWGIAQTFPVAQTVAIATLAGLFFTKDKERIPKEPETILQALLWVLFFITTNFAFYPENAWLQLEETSKILLMSFVTIMVVSDHLKLRYLLLVIALSLGLLGLKGGVFTILTGGSHNVRGPDKSFIAGEGDFALALNMALPMLFYLAKTERNRNLKLLLYICFAFTIVSSIFTYRRGAFLGLAVVLSLLALKSRRKAIAVLIVFLLVPVLILSTDILPERWFSRMETIQTYDEDASAMGRIHAWRVAWRVAVDRPLIGGGFGTFRWKTYEKYAPEFGSAADVHNSFLEVLGEHGFIAFGLFIAMLAAAFRSLGRIKIVVRRLGMDERFASYAEMLQISLTAYMVGGMFLGRGYFDFMYHLIIITVILKQIVWKELYLRMQKQPEEQRVTIAA